jgi:hypothetical protein
MGCCLLYAACYHSALYRQDGDVYSVATGTLFRISDRHFIITARHIFDDLDPQCIAYPEHPDKTVRWTIGMSRLVKPDTDQIDVAIIELLENATTKRLISGWQFLTLNNVAPATDDGTFALMGYPSEFSTPRAEWKPTGGIVYVSNRMGAPSTAPDLNPAIDLFFEYGPTALKQGQEEVNPPDLSGTSGGSVWEYVDLEGGLWAPAKVLKVVGVQSAQLKKKYFRAVGWGAVASIFGQMDEDLRIAIQQALEP